jgi:hypothetical protein
MTHETTLGDSQSLAALLERAEACSTAEELEVLRDMFTTSVQGSKHLKRFHLTAAPCGSSRLVGTIIRCEFQKRTSGTYSQTLVFELSASRLALFASTSQVNALGEHECAPGFDHEVDWSECPETRTLGDLWQVAEAVAYDHLALLGLLPTRRFSSAKRGRMTRGRGPRR